MTTETSPQPPSAGDPQTYFGIAMPKQAAWRRVAKELCADRATRAALHSMEFVATTQGVTAGKAAAERYFHDKVNPRVLQEALTHLEVELLGSQSEPPDSTAPELPSKADGLGSRCCFRAHFKTRFRAKRVKFREQYPSWRFKDIGIS